MEIMNAYWRKRNDGLWEICDLPKIPLEPVDAADSFYQVKNDLFASNSIFGTIKSIMGQSIVPVVVKIPDDDTLRCLGTGFFVSCTGLLITAAHVITAVLEKQLGGVRETDDQTLHLGDIRLGVMVSLNHLLTGGPSYIYRDIEWASFLASRAENPLPIKGIDLRITSDIAICKAVPIGDGAPYQPLSIVQPKIKGIGMAVGKTVAVVGYGAMKDVELERVKDGFVKGKLPFELHVSKGQMIERFPNNAVVKAVPTPGPCFSASTKLPPGMSGSPIFEDKRSYVHGVVSRGWEDEGGLADFGYGSMLAPSMQLPIRSLGGRSIFELMAAGEHGIPVLVIPDA